jgi:hypothetical protein
MLSRSYLFFAASFILFVGLMLERALRGRLLEH